ncbi:hypothetical protein G7Y89_g2472 [Cudoniella acicularis]|uniref:MHYT domain-containing protein n=1 Tax=Cudoniella acicularis TaxID=354080 RepID=A0A8H4RU27_9HELO|nr:hypothetical protein G7Y89_g2472 [Cudoniella acicularis]
MSDDFALWQEWEGHIVPREFSTGYVVLSYVVSFVGAWTTLELISRRTFGRGFYNWSLLFGASISMGGVAIWCMHFISNRAITLGDGQTSIQIAYNPGFTAISFFVPILVLLAAFTAFGSNDRVSLFRVSAGGTLAGLAICGMHYLGQAGISNYTCVYSIINVVGSAIVAVAASIVALSVFFVLRATWTDSWWKRALCAIILAGAVFGMHWLASVGTQYRLKKTDPSSSHNISRDSTVVVVIVLSIAACLILVVFTTVAQRRRALSADRAQQVVLASAIFDQHGRIMVTPEGRLPNQKIMTSYVEWSLDDILGISHPVFHWTFRASRNWSSVSNVLCNMRNHLYSTSTSPTSYVDLNSDEGMAAEHYSAVFRQLFCVAAADLAEQLNEPLEDVGVLFHEIFSTGQVAVQKSKARQSTTETSVDLERDDMVPTMPGRGRLLFLVRRADRKEADRLSASGYRFAKVTHVVNIIARSMQINCHDLQGPFSRMCEYANGTNILRPGVYLACFAIRSSPRGGFDVLVRKGAGNQLPATQLPIDCLNDWKINYLSRLDGWSVTACLTFLRSKLVCSTILKREQIFATQLCHTLEALRQEINDPLFDDALLIGTTVAAPSCGVGEDGKPNQAILIAFRLTLPTQFRATGQNLEFTHLGFFRTQQAVENNSSDHALFARNIHEEFGSAPNRKRMSKGGGWKNLKSARFLNSIRNPKSRSMQGIMGQSDVSLPALVSNAHTKNSGSRDWNRNTDRELKTQPRVNSDRDPETELVEAQTFRGSKAGQEGDIDVRDLTDESSGAKVDGELGVKEIEETQDTQMGGWGRVMNEVEDRETTASLAVRLEEYLDDI